MFSCCALFSTDDNGADMEHLKALDVSSCPTTPCRLSRNPGRHFLLYCWKQLSAHVAYKCFQNGKSLWFGRKNQSYAVRRYSSTTTVQSVSSTGRIDSFALNWRLLLTAARCNSCPCPPVFSSTSQFLLGIAINNACWASSVVSVGSFRNRAYN